MLEKLPDSIGHLLKGQRAGLEKILFNRIDLRVGTGTLEITSLAFADHAPLPPRFTADDETPTSPSLRWRDLPDAASSLALIVEDADSPTPEPLVHAIAVNIDPQREGFEEGELESNDASDSSVELGRNSYLRQEWLPPDPPPGHGVHRYAFQLFALVDGPPLSDNPGREELANAVRERAIASGCLIGTYSRDNSVKVEDDEAAAVTMDAVAV